MTDATANAVQDNTANTAQGGDQAGAAGVMFGSTEPANTDAGQPAGNANEGDNGQAPSETQTDNKDAKAGAPEKYEFKAPEGVELDAAAIAEFEPLARELNLNQEQAQKLLELHTKTLQNQAQSQTQVAAKQIEAWVGEIKADKEIGGTNFDSSVRHAQAAAKKFGSPEFLAALDATGMGSHPELVRVFARIGKAMAEDTFVQPGKESTVLDPAKKLFPSMS
jgi:predicted DNA-binding protein (UPF0251 family)